MSCGAWHLNGARSVPCLRAALPLFTDYEERLLVQAAGHPRSGATKIPAMRDLGVPCTRTSPPLVNRRVVLISLAIGFEHGTARLLQTS